MQKEDLFNQIKEDRKNPKWNSTLIYDQELNVRHYPKGSLEYDLVAVMEIGSKLINNGQRYSNKRAIELGIDEHLFSREQAQEFKKAVDAWDTRLKMASVMFISTFEAKIGGCSTFSQFQQIIEEDLDQLSQKEGYFLAQTLFDITHPISIQNMNEKTSDQFKHITENISAQNNQLDWDKRKKNQYSSKEPTKNIRHLRPIISRFIYCLGGWFRSGQTRFKDLIIKNGGKVSYAGSKTQILILPDNWKTQYRLLVSKKFARAIYTCPLLLVESEFDHILENPFILIEKFREHLQKYDSFKFEETKSEPMKDIDRKKLEEMALIKIESMREFVDEAMLMVSELEKKGLVGEKHIAKSSCICKSCLIYRFAHKLKK